MIEKRPVVLLTGLGRQVGIAAGIAEKLASDGWDIAFVYSSRYDTEINGGAGNISQIVEHLDSLGAATVAIEADLGDPDVTSGVFDVAETLGPVTALVLSHAHSTTAGVLDATVESFDRHFAVNTRASWLLIRELARRLDGWPDRNPRRYGSARGFPAFGRRWLDHRATAEV